MINTSPKYLIAGLERYVLGFVLLLLCIGSEAQQLAFPGAEGFGKFTTGGRGGRVIKVTNLNDDGPGSLRAAVGEKGPRIIVFTVSGNIDLQSGLSINHGDLTIAGQSAPGDGICLRNYPVRVAADNVIIRYMRFRMGDAFKQEADALGGIGRKRIIIDHCSISWATDECASFYYNSDFTMQWCIISESLNASVHAKGNHGYGGIWGGEGASFHHNLIAHHTSRLPRFSGSSTTRNPEDELVDFTNNVIYNWGGNSSYGGERGRYNIVNNYYKAGPATSPKVRDRIVNPWSPFGGYYIHGNIMHGFPDISADNWNGGVQGENVDSAKVLKPFDVVAINVQPAEKAYEDVLDFAGASLRRDEVDTRIVNEVRTGTASKGKKRNGIIDTPSEAGGYPELKTGAVPKDSDNDGMPDEWEIKNGLNPNDPTDAVGFSLDKNYTNIEIYLNSLVK